MGSSRAGSRASRLRSSEVPDYWTTTEGVNIVTDLPRIPEFQDLLTNTWRAKYTRDRKSARVPTGAHVLNVLRVENHPNFAKHCAFVNGIRKRRGACEPFDELTKGLLNPLPTDVNAMYLFHGTDPKAADKIANGDFNIDRAGSKGGSMLGPGLYMAENASKSDEYAREGDGVFMGQCALLVCRVVAGKVFTTTEKGNWMDKVKLGNFDSVCGDRLAAVGTFREMVFYDSAAVYPEFIVIYRRTYDEPAALPAALPAAIPTPCRIRRDDADEDLHPSPLHSSVKASVASFAMMGAPASEAAAREKKLQERISSLAARAAAAKSKAEEERFARESTAEKAEAEVDRLKRGVAKEQLASSKKSRASSKKAEAKEQLAGSIETVETAKKVFKVWL